MNRPLLIVACALAAAGCGTTTSSAPKDDPGKAAVQVLEQIVHNRYGEAWADLHPTDQRVAPRGEYVSCERRSPVLAVPISVRVVRVAEESVGLGDGRFVDSTAVDLRLGFRGGYHLVHTVHLVASGGAWKWILPSWRFRDYRADRCPVDSRSTA